MYGACIPKVRLLIEINDCNKGLTRKEARLQY